MKKYRRLIVFLVILIFAAIIGISLKNSKYLAFSGPAIIRVSTTGNDSNDGSSWTLAKKTIGSAIATAGTSATEIWIQKGTYQESGLRISGNTAGLGFYGGFNGTETAKESRPLYQENSTVIDSQKQASNLKFSYSGNTTIDRLTLINGKTLYNGGCLDYATGSGMGYLNLTNVVLDTCEATNTAGGGMYIRGVDLMFNNLTVKNSTAGQFGGGIYASSTDFSGNKLLVENCTALQGGGVYAYGIGSGTQYHSKIFNATIRNNIATSSNQYEGGGGMVLEGVQTVDFDRLFISNNTANYGGALIAFGGTANNTITNTIISGNHSGTAAILVKDSNTRPMLCGVTITDNTSTVGASAIYEANSTALEIIGMLITYNTAPADRGAIGHDNSSNFINYQYSIRYSNLPRTFDDLKEDQQNGMATGNPQFISRSQLTNPLSYQPFPGSKEIDSTSEFASTDFSGAKRPIDGKGYGTAYTDTGAFEYQGVQQHFVLTGFSGDQSSKLVSFVAKDSGGNVVGSGDLPQASDGFFVLPAKSDSTAFKKDSGPYTFFFSADGYQTTDLIVPSMPADNSIGQTVTLTPVSSPAHLLYLGWVGKDPINPGKNQEDRLAHLRTYTDNTKTTLLADTDFTLQGQTTLGLGNVYILPNKTDGTPHATGQRYYICLSAMSYLQTCKYMTMIAPNNTGTNIELNGGDAGGSATNHGNDPDGQIGLADMGKILLNFALPASQADPPASDIDGNLSVGLADMGLVLGNFGQTGD